MGEEIKLLSEYENGTMVFDDFLGTSNSRYIEKFSISGRHNSSDIYYRPQSYFDLPKRRIRNNSKKNFVFTETLKDTENIYKDVGGYDMSYDE